MGVCPHVSSGCIALHLGMPGMPAVTSGYHTAFIPSAHEYRDRDTDRSYPLAESRDEISQIGTEQNKIKTKHQREQNRGEFPQEKSYRRCEEPP